LGSGPAGKYENREAHDSERDLSATAHEPQLPHFPPNQSTNSAVRAGPCAKESI
jgi:hypothetical protein